MTTTFAEVQKFTDIWWTWLLEIGITVLVIWVGYKFIRFYRSKEENINPIFMVILLILLFLPIGLNVLLLMGKLETNIDSDGINYNYIPFGRQGHIAWQDIDTIYTRQYSPSLEYGGWGLKGSSDNKAFNVYGDMGIQIRFKNSKRLLLGTQKPKEAQTVLTALHH